MHDLETDLILLSARGKRLVPLRGGIEFAVIVLDRNGVEALLIDRPLYATRRIGEAVRHARMAVERGG